MVWQQCNTVTEVCVLKDDACDTDNACFGKTWCDLEQHTCVPDTRCDDTICDDWESCYAGICILKNGWCIEDDDCRFSQKCGSEHQCVDLCDEVTCNSWEVCQKDSGVCVATQGYCNEEADCNGDFLCNPVYHICLPAQYSCLSVICSGDAGCINGVCICPEEGHHMEGAICHADSKEVNRFQSFVVERLDHELNTVSLNSLSIDEYKMIPFGVSFVVAGSVYDSLFDLSYGDLGDIFWFTLLDF